MSAGVPEFPHDATWLGVDHPLQFAGTLRGQVVLVAFWATSDVHSWHLVAELEHLALQFAGRRLVVVAAHAGRLPGEDDVDRVRSTAAMLGLRQPILMDRDRALWKQYGAKAWPTVVLVDGTGERRFQGGGQPDHERMAQAIDMLVDEAELAATGDFERVVAWPTEPPRAVERIDLLAPAGLAVDVDRDLLWIADAGRHRILGVDLRSVASHRSELRTTIGSGEPGCGDGDVSYATFHGPRGLALLGGRLFVADTGNHAVRVVDPDAADVRLLVGQIRPVSDRQGGAAGGVQGLCAPVALAAIGQRLQLCCAGVRQVWDLDPISGQARALTSGDPDRAFGLPMAIAGSGDSESIVGDADRGELTRVHGQSPVQATAVADGDAMGWPTGVAMAGDHVAFVADMLGDVIWRVDLATGERRVVVPADAGLRGPTALAVVAVGGEGDTLVICDTGNQRVVSMAIEGGEVDPARLTELEIVDPHPDYPEPEPPPIKLRASIEHASLCFVLPRPSGSFVPPEVPAHAWLRNVDGDPILAGDQDFPIDQEGDWGVLRSVATAAPGVGRFELLVRSLTCEDYDTVPHAHERRAIVAVESTMDGSDTVDVRLV